MCGIAGVMFVDGRRTAEAERCASRMLDALRHRGPDGSGLWVSPQGDGPAVALAHARLAIIDLSEGGRQPMAGPGGTQLTFNGEIYNFAALRAAREADGVRFRSHSDTEALLAEYARFGDNAWPHLEGMFAFAMWDPSARVMRLVRDRLGIKPLYYYAKDGAIAFASEVRALLASGLVPRRVSGRSLWHYLGYQTAPTPETLIDGVRMLEPGRCLTVQADGRQSAHTYWQVFQAAEPAPRTRADAVLHVRSLLRHAVTSHTVSDVPVGVFLSGGIDSGAIVSSLASAGVTPRTFSVAFDDPQLDESAIAREVAAMFGAEHHEISLSADAMAGMLPEVLESVDHPSGDGVNSYVVSKLVRDHGIKVALSGLGGDEVFGGYPSFERLSRLTPILRAWGKSPAPMRQAAAELVRKFGPATTGAKTAALLESDGDPAHTWPVTRQVFSREARRALLPAAEQHAAIDDEYESLLADAYGDVPSAGLWAQVSFAELRTYMHDVLLRDTDQMSMAHALEVRVPLLDHRLVEYVVSLPDDLKRGATSKALLVESLERPLPSSVTHRPKRGFALPFDDWMRGRLRTFCEAQIQGLEARRMFASGEPTRAWQKFLSGELTWSRGWTLVALESWLSRQQLDEVVW